MSKAAIAVLGLLIAPGAWPGVVFEVKSNVTGEAPQNLEIAIEGAKLAITGNADGDVVYDGAAQSMLAISHADKAYTVIDKAAAESIAEKINPVLEQLERVSPAKRAEIEKLIGARLPDSRRPAIETELVNTKRKNTIGDFDCVWWEATQNDVKVREMCVAPKGSFPEGDAVMAVISSMSGFYEDVFAQFSGSFDFSVAGNPFADVGNMQGLPVETRMFRDGALESDTVIESATVKSLGPETFEPPAGYERRSIGVF